MTGVQTCALPISLKVPVLPAGGVFPQFTFDFSYGVKAAAIADQSSVEYKAVSPMAAEECQAPGVRINRCQKSPLFKFLGRTGKYPAKGLFQLLDGSSGVI